MNKSRAARIEQLLVDPPKRYSLIPMWFWNDVMTEAEVVRQIESFRSRGVYGFMIHPRVGLPRDIGWMSDRMLHFMHVAIEEAARREMLVSCTWRKPSVSACLFLLGARSQTR